MCQEQVNDKFDSYIEVMVLGVRLLLQWLFKHILEPIIRINTFLHVLFFNYIHKYYFFIAVHAWLFVTYVCT